MVASRRFRPSSGCVVGAVWLIGVLVLAGRWWQPAAGVAGLGLLAVAAALSLWCGRSSLCGDPRIWWRLVLPTAGAALIAGIWTAAYVGSERAIYIWDHATYWQIARRVAERFSENPMRALDLVDRSIQTEDYNDLAALPLLPSLLVFGGGRLVYVVTIAMLGVVSVGGVAAVWTWRWLGPRAVWVPLVVVLTLPPLWVPVVRGFVDVLGVALGIAAVGMWSRLRVADRLSWSQVVACGTVLATMFLFRRWYAFWAVGFAVAVSVDTACVFAWSRPRGWKVLRMSVGVGGVAAVVVLGVAAPLVGAVLATDYGLRYEAYRFGASLLEHLRWSIGDAWLGLFGLALVRMLASSVLRSVAVFVCVVGLAALVSFHRTQDLGAHHIYLVMPTLVVILGCGLAQLVLDVSGPDKRNLRRRTAFIVAASLLSLFGVTSMALEFHPRLTATHRVLAENLGLDLVGRFGGHPLRRDDWPELERLMEFLDRRPDDEKVYVLAATGALNGAVFRNWNLSLGQDRSLPRVLTTACIDRVHGFPDELFEADLVLVAWMWGEGGRSGTPYEHCPADLKGQAVVELPFDSFQKNLDLARAFKRRTEHYVLDGPAAMYVFERVRPSTEDEVRAFSDRLRSRYPDDPEIFRPRSTDR